MFKISLQNVGSNMVTKDVTAHVDTLYEAVIYTKGLIEGILGYKDFTLLPRDSDSYTISHNETLVGSFEITKLN